MFSVYCPRHQRRVLLGPTDIVSLSADPHGGGGFTIGYRCSCGHEGHWPPSHCEDAWDRCMAG